MCEPPIPVESDLTPHATRRDHERRVASPLSGTRVQDKRPRISSRTPVMVSIAALLVGSALSLAAMLNAFTEPIFGALLLILAAAHLFVGITLTLSVKSVSFDGHRYWIKGIFLTEEIAPTDVCLVVEARGVLWNTIRLHFNRPTRFGYDIGFVPAVSRKDFAACLRELRNPNGSSLSLMEAQRTTRPPKRN